MHAHAETACPVCESATFRPFFAIDGLPPLSCALYPTREEARDCPRGEMVLAGCRDCGYIANVAFDPALIEYDGTYENALHFSQVYRDYAKREAEALIQRYDLHGKRVVDIGCGDGRFLSLLCELGGNQGIGYDPSFKDDSLGGALHPDVRIETRYFGPQDAGEAPDLIVSRQVLEHIYEPAGFLRTLRSGLNGHDGTRLAFEVPNAEYLIADLSVWDLIYEHCSFFTASSLATLFQRAGFAVEDLHVGFGNQTLTVEALPAGARMNGHTHPAAQASDAQIQAMQAFEAEAGRRIEGWRKRLSEWKESGAKVALWGAGARAVVFLNVVGAEGAFDTIVDLNPRKHGAFLPGTGDRIDAPEALSTAQPDVVLLMNPNYQTEVAASLRELGVEAELVLA